jgi:GNAT superfamily N-acetyltransferase
MLIHDSDITTGQSAELQQLISLCFGADSHSPIAKAALRAIQVDSGIVGHAAINVRQYSLEGALTAVALLGCVCVHPGYRGRGIGHTLITELHRATPLPFLLNCGKPVVGYYSQLGYVVIADAATYDRDGAVQLDLDPVMGFANGLPVSMHFHDVPFHLGADF